MQYANIIEILAANFNNNANTMTRTEEKPMTERDRELEVDATFRSIKFEVEGYKDSNITFITKVAQLKYAGSFDPSVDYAYAQIGKDDLTVQRFASIEEAHKASGIGSDYLRVLRDLSDLVKSHGSDATFLSSGTAEKPAVSMFFKCEGMLFLLNFKKN